MKTLPQKVNRPSRSFRTAALVVACAAAAGACGGTDFEIASVDGGVDASTGVDAHKRDARDPDAGTRETGVKDSSKDTGGHSDGSSGTEAGPDASVDAAADVGPRQDSDVADGAQDVGAMHDAVVDEDGPKACSGGALSCTAPSSCPLAPVCAVAMCDEGCCASQPAAVGTQCSGPDGTVCNGTGACVECVKSSECPPSMTKCVVPVCTSGDTCATDSAPIDTTCGDHGGQLCNGAGQCVVCTSDNASACTGGTPYCGSGGTCVACLTNAQCGGLTPTCANGTCEL